MKIRWLRSICFFTFINFHQYAEGRHSLHKNPDDFVGLHTLETNENTKEIRIFLR
jgi:hypothetical protein